MLFSPSDKQSSRKSKGKRTPSKSRITQHQNEISDDFTIAGNQTAALNWIDEVIKDKPFTLRNFETDKSIYNNIKPVPNIDDMAEQKITAIINNITAHKTNALTQAKEKDLRAHGLIATTPAKPTEIIGDYNRYRSAGMAMHRRKTIDQATPAENGIIPTSPNVTSVQTSMQPPSHSTPITARSSPAPVFTPIRLNSPQNPVIAISSAQPVHVISVVQPVNVVNITAQSPISNPVNKTLPHLLSLPTRVPLRNRAMSVSMSQNEYTATTRLNQRRPSVCDNNLPKTNSPSAASKVIALDQHKYINGDAQKTPQPLKVDPRATFLPPAFMTKVHDTQFINSQTQLPSPVPITKPAALSTLKVLTPDDLNSRK